MKIRSMRSILIILLICLVSAVPATAETGTVTQSIYYKEAATRVCTDDTYAGSPTGSILAIVELSGHGEILIDGQALSPIGTDAVQGHDAVWFETTPGTHHIYIAQKGYSNYIANLPVCSGKVTYAYYDQEAHIYPGTTRTEAPTTTTTVEPTTTTFTGQSTDLKAALGPGRTVPPGNLGSLSVTTDPAGATIYIDGIQQGISPATIPGITPGSHTLLLKREGYEDLSLPVVISAGSTQYYSSALKKSGAALPVATTKKSSAPGCAAVFGACVVGALLILRRTRP